MTWFPKNNNYRTLTALYKDATWHYCWLYGLRKVFKKSIRHLITKFTTCMLDNIFIPRGFQIKVKQTQDLQINNSKIHLNIYYLLCSCLHMKYQVTIMSICASQNLHEPFKRFSLTMYTWCSGLMKWYQMSSMR